MIERTLRQQKDLLSVCGVSIFMLASAAACSEFEDELSQEEFVEIDSDDGAPRATYEDTSIEQDGFWGSETSFNDSEDGFVEDTDEAPLEGQTVDEEQDTETIPRAEEPQPFFVVVISDTHVRLPGNPDDGKYSNAENLLKLNRAVEKINSQAPEAAFVAVTGDLVGCLFSGDPDDYLTGEENPAETFKEIMDNLVMPYYVALGNHDYEVDFVLGEGINAKNPRVPEVIWNKVLGVDPYYSFVYNQTRFVFLNSARGPARKRTCLGSLRESYCTGSFDEEQIAWLESELSKPEQSFLFFHHPLITDHPFQTVWSAAGTTFQVEQNDAFYGLAKDFKHEISGVFVGHGHLWAHDTLHGAIDVYETGSIGDTLSNSNNIRLVRVDPSTQTSTVAKL